MYGVDDSTPINCDNTKAEASEKNSVQHQQTKNIEAREYFVRKKFQVEEDLLQKYNCNTKGNVVDIFTKALGKENFT